MTIMLKVRLSCHDGKEQKIKQLFLINIWVYGQNQCFPNMTQDFRLVLMYVPAVAPDTALVMAVLATALFLFISSSKSVSGICLKKEIMCLVSCTIEQKTSQIHNLFSDVLQFVT